MNIFDKIKVKKEERGMKSFQELEEADDFKLFESEQYSRYDAENSRVMGVDKIEGNIPRKVTAFGANWVENCHFTDPSNIGRNLWEKV